MRHPLLSLVLIAAIGALLGYGVVTSLGLRWDPWSTSALGPVAEHLEPRQDPLAKVPQSALVDANLISEDSLQAPGSSAPKDPFVDANSAPSHQGLQTDDDSNSTISTSPAANPAPTTATPKAARKKIRRPLAALPPIESRDLRFGLGDCPPNLFDGKGHLISGSDDFTEQRLQWLLADYEVPEGAVVLMEPATGKILAAAGYRAPGDNDREIALEPSFLSASTFKIVTASALLDSGLGLHQEICYHGGRRDVDLRELQDNPRRDKACTDLSSALAFSRNVPIAKWTDRTLSPVQLSARARRFGFSAPFAGPARRCFGQADIPQDRLALAQTGAGFGQVRMSAWHGALLASLVANRGLLPSQLSDGKPVRILPQKTTSQLAQALAQTVNAGTAMRAFRDRGRYVLKDFSAAGKTGSLTEGEGKNWREITWFVGFAPVDNPQVAVAAVIVNDPKWRIRAAYVGREALRTFLLRTEPYRPTQDPGR